MTVTTLTASPDGLETTTATDTLNFFYSASGDPLYVDYNGTPYYYAANLQGDTVAILDGSGNPVVTYTYDAWGKLLSVGGSLKDTLGALNPLTYRGYVYDTETDLYYLQSRYYNPTASRFLNADALVATGQGILGNNMLTYCSNNPANCYDPTGYATITRISIFDDPTKEIFFGFGGGGGGGGCAYAFSAAREGAKIIKKFESVMHNSSEATAQRNLDLYGATFYKGALVLSADLPAKGSAFSFGVIILDDCYTSASKYSFSTTLNHEYGHFQHMQDIGVMTYATTTALPSLIFAGISNANIPYVSELISGNYYSLPWERIADYYGDVTRSYLPGANALGSVYWMYTYVTGILLS